MDQMARPVSRDHHGHGRLYLMSNYKPYRSSSLHSSTPFAKVLQRTAMGMTSDDLDLFMMSLIADRLIKRRQRDDINSPARLITFLLDSNLINRHGVQFLVSRLCEIKRRDLANELETYEKQLNSYNCSSSLNMAEISASLPSLRPVSPLVHGQNLVPISEVSCLSDSSTNIKDPGVDRIPTEQEESLSSSQMSVDSDLPDSQMSISDDEKLLHCEKAWDKMVDDANFGHQYCT